MTCLLFAYSHFIASPKHAWEHSPACTRVRARQNHLWSLLWGCCAWRWNRLLLLSDSVLPKIAKERKPYRSVLKQALSHVTNHDMLASGALLLHLRGQEVRIPGSPGRHPLVGCCRPFCKTAPAPCSLLALFWSVLKIKEGRGKEGTIPIQPSSQWPFFNVEPTQ